MTTETNQENLETTETAPEQESTELLAGKFKSQEELVKAYENLESKLGAPKEEPVADSMPQIQIPESAVEETGLTMERLQELSATFAEQGGLTDEQYEALEKANGLSRDLVDDFISTKVSQVQSTQERLLEPLGGMGGFEKASEWAANNLSEEQVAQLNAALAGDENTAAMAVNMLKTQYEASAGQSIDLLTGRTSGSTMQAFNSQAEVSAAMRDPRYRVDPHYRSQVASRLAISSF